MGKLTIEQIRDPKFYLEHFVKIKGKQSGQLIDFRLKKAQIHLFNVLKTNRKVMALKARQLGISSAVAGWLYHRAITVPGTSAGIIGYNQAMARELMDKIKLFIETTPDELKPTITKKTSTEIEFGKMHSKIQVIASKNAGRGYTFTDMLLSEPPYWEDLDAKMDAILGGLPENGTLILESTPSMAGDRFHRMWTDDDNGFVKLELGWWWEYTQEQMEAKRKEYSGDDARFRREFCMEFGVEGGLVFDKKIISQQRRGQLDLGMKNHYMIGDVKHPATHEYEVHEEDRMIQYQPPIPGRTYVMGADVAQGISGGDYSTMTMFDRLTGEQVAFFRGKVDPDHFGEMLDRWGRKYNFALIVFEVNNHGNSVLTILKQKAYPNVYYRIGRYDVAGMDMTSRMGFITNEQTRGMLINDFRKCARDMSIIIRSKDILNEMMTFVWKANGKGEAASGCHDDSVMSAMLAVQGFSQTVGDYDLSQPDISQFIR
ncbi:MAG: hypothetical protein WC455_10665 [Dehalococcoidia bacterium]|jgi:hypothetical protein